MSVDGVVKGGRQVCKAHPRVMTPVAETAADRRRAAVASCYSNVGS